MLAAQPTTCSREASRRGLRVSGNGTSIAGSSRRPTGWNGTWVKLRSRCGAVAASDETMRAACVPSPSGPPRTGATAAVARGLVYREDCRCHSWPPDCQSCSPLDVQAHAQPGGRIQAVFVAQGGQLGERGVLELLQPGGEQVVHPIGGLLGLTPEEPLQDQHPVGQLALVVDLTLVGEQVVAQMHGIGERVPHRLHRAGGGDWPVPTAIR